MTSTRKVRVLLIAAVAALAIAALGASSAAASLTLAKFSSSTLKVTTNTSGLTVKRSGLEPKTCTLQTPIEAVVENSAVTGWNAPWLEGGTRYSCSSGASELTQSFVGTAFFDNVANNYVLRFSAHNVSLVSPWGSYKQQAFNGSWTNGSGLTPSTITFNNTTAGSTVSGSMPVSLTGSLNVTTPSGGLVTLSH